MSWSPEDDDEPQQQRPNTNSLCPCDMCCEQGAYSTELDKEDIE